MESLYWARFGNPAQIYQMWLLFLRSHPLKAEICQSPVLTLPYAQLLLSECDRSTNCVSPEVLNGT
jgi:hypothetical protein